MTFSQLEISHQNSQGERGLTMEHTRFEDLARFVSDGASRRAAFRLLAGGVIGGVAGWQGILEDSAAKGKGKKKKKRKKGRCYGSLPV